MSNPAEGPLAVGEAFGRYHVIRLLGMGGMGAVYHAWDQELGVGVALKVIRPEATADPAAAADMERRFKRELLLARQVTHANVVRIHDLGELNGIKYITMSYIEGEDLATRLKRDGKLPVSTALTIARQVAAGLSAAHEAGVVHRDLKPANIMLDADLHASIMDFGIARSAEPPPSAPPPPNAPAPSPSSSRVSPQPSNPGDGAKTLISGAPNDGATRVVGNVAGPPQSAVGAFTTVGDGETLDGRTRVGQVETDEGLTFAPASAPANVGTRPSTVPRTGPAAFASIGEGRVVGTLEYMAPEQAMGEALDHRADCYAFGMILSEMLIGRRRAADGLNAIAALQQRIQTPPTSLRAVAPAVPVAVDAIALRCLQIDPGKRFESTQDLVTALNRLDDQGVVIPEARHLTRRLMVGAAVTVAALLGVTYWTARVAPAPTEHAAVSVLIADFNNSTSDAALDATIEQSLGIALEGASFITNFPRATANSIARGLKATNGIDEPTARLIAVREGITVIVTGEIATRGSGYRIDVKTLDPNGSELSSFSGNASGRDDVLRVVSQLASSVRDQFGDTTPATAREAEAETFTTASLDAVGEYAIGQDLASAGRDEDAIGHYRAALEKDPRFGRAYSGWAVSAFKTGRSEEAAETYKKAFSVLDRMTEREKLRTLGAYYLQVAGSYDKAIDNYSQLVARYPADRGGHSNLAIAHFASLNFAKALEEGRQAIQIYPRNVTFRSNVALFALYASDFQTATEEAARVVELDPTFHKGYLPQAIGAIDRGAVDEARAAYERMAGAGVVGASLSASGLADLEILVGRYKDAETRLRAAIAVDDRQKRTEGAIAKRVALATSLIGQGRLADARKEAAVVIALSPGVTARVPAARVLAATGADADAMRIVEELDNQLQPQKRAYARIIEGEIAMARRRTAAAVDSFVAARKFTDLWLARFNLGVAYVQAGAFAEAVSELELAQKRRGEATAMFLDDWPTAHQLATLQYWLGRANEGLGASPAARQNYDAFIKLRGAVNDPLVLDARKRLSSLGAGQPAS